MIDFGKLLQEIRDNTGWSDYEVAEWINRGNKRSRIVEQPQIYNMRMKRIANPDYEPRYRLGRKILDLHKFSKQLKRERESALVENAEKDRAKKLGLRANVGLSRAESDVRGPRNRQ